MITQNEISLARRESGRKALISFGIATFHPTEPRRYCCISRSAMMPPGALTARLSSFLRNRPDKSPQPRTYTVTHSTGVSKILRLHSRSVRFDFRNARPVPSQTCFRLQIAVCISSVKTMSFNQMKRQEAQSRMAATRKARRSPAAAAAEQRRASLVGNGAKWRITNFKQVARAMSKWA
jgi:hypothetical protein